MPNYRTNYAYRLGMAIHTVIRASLGGYLSDPPEPPPVDPPEPPPVDPPEPAPVDPPEPAPAPQPVPPPDPEPPEPAPPNPDPIEYDDLIFSGAMVLVNAKNPKSHEGRWWFKVDDALLNSWTPTSARHLLRILGKHAHPLRNCVVFCLASDSKWWPLVAELSPWGLLEVPD